MATVIGLFNTPSQAALCLDNLAEADFGPDTTSLVMDTPAAAEAVAHVAGSLAELPVEQLAKRLTDLGISPSDVAAYVAGIRAGGAFLAVDVDDADTARAAAEMLQDAHARLIQTVFG